MRAPSDDIDRLMAVMDCAFDPAFGEAWTRRQVEDALLIGNCHYILIDAAGHMPPADDAPAAGFSLSRGGYEEEELLLFAVAPEYRGMGLGRAMLQQLAKNARFRNGNRLLLEMRDGNPAEQLYRSFGFTPIGRRPNYYRNAAGGQIDAITFQCDID
ncbi:MAG: GNAT family N-acetyltransferase [Sphingomonadales bacterium]|nr:GNAT family N-acetyltransferase [Sphingomonadales bacterium]